MIVKSTDLMSKGSVTEGPFTFAQIKVRPGVYMTTERWDAAIVVVLNDSRMLYVNSGWVQNYDDVDLNQDAATDQFWLSDLALPDNVIP